MTTTTTRWLPFDAPNLTTTLGGTATPVAVPGTIGNFNMSVTTAPGAGASWTFNLYKNGSATGYSLTISGTNTSVTDNSSTTTVAAGDLIAWQLVPSASPAPAAAVMSASYSFTGTNSGETTIGACTSTNYATGATAYIPPFMGSFGFQASDVLVSAIMPCAGVLDQWRMSTTAPGSVNSEIWTVYKNGVPTLLTITVTGSATTGSDLTDSVTVAAGDTISIQVVPSGAFSVSAYRGSFRWTPTTNGQTPLTNVAGATVVATRFPVFHGNSVTLTPEANSAIAAPVAFQLSQLTFTVNTAPGASKSWTLVSRDGGVSKTVTATISGASQTSASDTTDTDTFNQGDLVNWQLTSSGSPTNGTSTKISAIAYISSGGNNYTETLTETVTFSDTLLKSTAMLLSETVTYSDALLKQVALIFSETVTYSDALIRQISKTLSDTVTYSDTLLKQLARIFVETVTYSDALQANKVTQKMLSETVTYSDALKKQATKLLSETVTYSDTLKRQTARILSEVVTYTDAVAKQLSINLSEVVTFTDNLVAQTIHITVIAMKMFVVSALIPIRVILKASAKAFTLLGETDNDNNINLTH